jgi:ABC-2 type transport system ATP-binding protein/lipopolysaccharide transport system ATP-binding protein
MIDMQPPSSIPIILLQAVSVCYRLPKEPIGSFKEYVIQFLQNKVRYHDFWALREIDLEILQGETFGIIGPNGAGKSTMLKVIARVLVPSSGRVRVQGKVAPLLELGAGFHPELTGRENIFLNGTLLGHKHREVNDRLEQILEFAQVDGFVDSPLRTYSSGMVARLGFAVATAWEPEILILDETLAVGDESFRAKCSSRLEEFQTKGTTTLLVTHDMGLAQSKCKRAALLYQGKIQHLGPIEEVVRIYRERFSV